MKFLIVPAILLILVIGLTPQANAKNSSRPNKIFVLAGQSNMEGRGQPVSAGATPDNRLFNWRSKSWVEASDALADPGNSQNGIGPGMTFGLSVINANPGDKIGLVMCAVGGTSIADWQPNGSLYKNCVAQARATKLPVAGELFLQGEADARAKNTAANWKKAFTKTYNAFRADLGGKFMLGQIGSIDPSSYPYQATVRDQQARAAAVLKLPLVITSDLATNNVDHTHFTVESYKTVGDRFASAYLNN